MEQALASRWFVWIGGLAIAIGGLLFVKYAYDNNLIPPAVQIVLGLIAGAALVAAGEFVRRKSAPAMEQSYVPAALSAGGIVTLFGSIYAAYALYELIAPTPAFIGLAVVAIGALALSRLQGPLIAALGLIGSYVTPAIIPSDIAQCLGPVPLSAGDPGCQLRHIARPHLVVAGLCRHRRLCSCGRCCGSMGRSSRGRCSAGRPVRPCHRPHRLLWYCRACHPQARKRRPARRTDA